MWAWLFPRLVGWSLMALGAVIMVDTADRFLPAPRFRLQRVFPYLLFFSAAALPTWVGDNNPLFLFPFFPLVFLLAYGGPWFARVVTGAVFYTLLVPVGMLIDSSSTFPLHDFWYEVIKISIRVLFWLGIWLIARRLGKTGAGLGLPRRLWALIGALELAPLFATLTFTLQNRPATLPNEDNAELLRMAYTILPFAALSSLAILVALVALSRHEALEEKQRLAELREAYYDALQREQTEVRTLRHDMHNHLAVVQSRLSAGDDIGAERYLEELAQSPAMRGTVRHSGNEVANAVLAAKLPQIERLGISWELEADLPADLPVSDIDLGALLGNALDNAIEAAQTAEDKTILLRARADKGMLMLRVENTTGLTPQQAEGRFLTTKPDKKAHGYGIVGMRDIAQKYGGSLQVKAGEGRFELLVYLPLAEETEKN